MYSLCQDKCNHTRGEKEGLCSSFAGLVYSEQHFPLPPGVYGFTIHQD